MGREKRLFGCLVALVIVGCGGQTDVKFSADALPLGVKIETCLNDMNTSELHGALTRAEQMERERKITANDLRVVREIQKLGSDNKWDEAKRQLKRAMER
jgi:hypothetical protein